MTDTVFWNTFRMLTNINLIINLIINLTITIIRILFIFSIKITDEESLRKAGHKVRNLLPKEIKSVDVVGEKAEYVAEGLLLSNYQFLKYFKDKAKKACALKEVNWVNGEKKTADYLNNNIRAVCWARDLVNEPLSYLTAPKLAEEIAIKGKEAGFFLIPLAPGIEDSKEIRKIYFDKIIDRLEYLTKQEIKSDILFVESFEFGSTDNILIFLFFLNWLKSSFKKRYPENFFTLIFFNILNNKTKYPLSKKTKSEFLKDFKYCFFLFIVARPGPEGKTNNPDFLIIFVKSFLLRLINFIFLNNINIILNY